MAGRYSLGPMNVSLAEGDTGATPFVFTIARSGGSTGPSSVDWAVTTGTGPGDADASDFGGYLPSGTVSFYDGEMSKSFEVYAFGDMDAEANERFSVSISNASDGGIIDQPNAQGLILNDDAAPTRYSIGPTSVDLFEGDAGSTPFTFTIARSGGSTGPSSVDWAVTSSAGFDAADASDFSGGVLPGGTVTFAAGELSKSVTVYVAGDTSVEAIERFSVGISNASDGGIIDQPNAQGLILNDDAGRYSISPAGVTVLEGDAGSTPAVFTVTRSGFSSGASTVDWAVTADGSNPADGADFSGGALPGGTVTFAPGETTRTITVSIRADTLVESDESFKVQLSNASEGSIETGSATTVIQNDDTSYAVAPASATVTEGNSGSTPFTFTVTRSGYINRASTVTWNTGSSDWIDPSSSDFAGNVMPSGVLSFAAGEASKTITVNVAGDQMMEGDESFFVRLTGASDGTASSVVAPATIIDDDTGLWLFPSTYFADEGDGGTTPFVFRVQRYGATTGTASVDWQVLGGSSATDATDFAGGVLPSGSVTFASGETLKTITIDVAGDTTPEADETFTVQLSNATGATIVGEFATSNIRNDDHPPGRYSLGPASVELTEGDFSYTPFTFTVSRSTSVGMSSVDWAVTTGTGPGDADASDFGGYLPSGTVSFYDGEMSKSFEVYAFGDMDAEANERFSVSISNASDGGIIDQPNAQGLILNDDAAPTRYSIGPTSVDLFEGDAGSTPFTFTIARSGGSTGPSSVDWAVTSSAGFDAADASDFSGGVLPGGTVTFAAGELSKSVTVYVAGDTSVEAIERFSVGISNASDGGIIDQPNAQGLILNDDAGRYSISPAGVTVLEGDAGSTPAVFTVTRSGFSSGASTVDWAVTADGSDPADGADFSGGALPGGTVTFAPGETTRTITLAIAGDTAVEASEGFRVTLSNPSEGTLDTAQATGTIVNDDASFAIAALSADKAEGSSGTSAFTFTVSRSGWTAGTSSVDWAVTSASAADGADFAGGVRPNGTVTFGTGETSRTITVAVAGDATVEADEGFTVQLSNATGTIGVGSATGTIRNDDASLSVAATNAARLEADNGSKAFTFTVTRSGYLGGTSSASWSVAGSGGSPANAADFTGNALPGGTVTFAAGEASKTITVNVAGDNKKEPDEGFTLTLSNAGGATIGSASATGTILNDDGPGNHRTASSANFPAFGTAMAAFGLSNPAADDSGFVFLTADGTLSLESGSGLLSAATDGVQTPWRQAESGFAILGGA